MNGKWWQGHVYQEKQHKNTIYSDKEVPHALLSWFLTIGLR